LEAGRYGGRKELERTFSDSDKKPGSLAGLIHIIGPVEDLLRGFFEAFQRQLQGYHVKGPFKRSSEGLSKAFQRPLKGLSKAFKTLYKRL
jgi:hypothetical protein